MKQSEKIKMLVLALVMGLAGSGLGFLIFGKHTSNEVVKYQNTDQTVQTTPVSSGVHNVLDLPDFTEAINKSLDAVVHIKTEYFNQSQDPLYNFFFGRPESTPILKGSGSGVIISKDGYIVTNNHVIENATNITVVLNNKSEYKAKLIGADPTTDIALLKIDADSLTTIPFGNSDNLQVGQWVLAIGNPFNLTSTVTAGIVSAKARNININRSRYAIESFIQTDAAVNPGNSGGALVDIDGNLVGINTAIASPTGTFAGYSFAIPVNIVQKVVSDLLQYGSVQRAYLGVSVVSVDDDIMNNYALPDHKGIFVTDVFPDGAADKAGIKPKDVILEFDGKEIDEVPQLLEQISLHRPGDKITLKIRRNNRIKNIDVVLTNENGETQKLVHQKVDVFGATFEDLTTAEKKELNISYGVKVTNVMAGKFLSAGIRPGYVILKINDKPVRNAKEVKDILSSVHGGVYIEGIYPESGMKAYYAFGVE